MSAVPAARFWASPWLKPFNDVEAIDDLLALLRPAWSLSRVRARVVGIRQETPDTKTFVLRPNWRWRGFAAGQHVVIQAEIGGVRYYRTFSLSSAPGDRELAITVKRAAGGKVTRWLHERLQVGAVLTLSDAAGKFVLPAEPPPRLLLLSAGSGLTPLMSMLHALQARGHRGDVTLVHSCRSSDDLIFARELALLERELPGLKLHLHYTAAFGRLTPEHLARLLPDAAAREVFMCGPAGFMTVFAEALQHAGATVHRENFGAPVFAAPAGVSVQVRAARSNRQFSGGSQPLLQEAEAAGLSPKHGCRIGICQSCKCRKRSGIVENLLTGTLSTEPDVEIQLCISAARSDLVLEL